MVVFVEESISAGQLTVCSHENYNERILVYSTVDPHYCYVDWNAFV